MNAQINEVIDTGEREKDYGFIKHISLAPIAHRVSSFEMIIFENKANKRGSQFQGGLN